jgi:hypothetical protein
MEHPRPISTSAPMIENGPISTSGANFAPSAMIAVGWMFMEKLRVEG